MAYPRYNRARKGKILAPLSGSTAIDTASAWADMSTHIASFTDVQLKECQKGDVIEVGLSGMWGNEAIEGNLDVVTIVSSAEVSYISTSTSSPAITGIRSWFGPSGTQASVSGKFQYVLRAVDVDVHVVTLRLRVMTGGSKTFYHDPAQLTAVNLGPTQGG